MLKQYVTFRSTNMGIWECCAKEPMDRQNCDLNYNSVHTTADCSICYARYVFRLYGTIKEIVMKYLQVAPKAQDVYKRCKFEVHSVPPSGGAVG
jgi:hypothetical protein